MDMLKSTVTGLVFVMATSLLGSPNGFAQTKRGMALEAGGPRKAVGRSARKNLRQKNARLLFAPKTRSILLGANSEIRVMLGKERKLLVTPDEVLLNGKPVTEREVSALLGRSASLELSTQEQLAAHSAIAPAGALYQRVAAVEAFYAQDKLPENLVAAQKNLQPGQEVQVGLLNRKRTDFASAGGIVYLTKGGLVVRDTMNGDKNLAPEEVSGLLLNGRLRTVDGAAPLTTSYLQTRLGGTP